MKKFTQTTLIALLISASVFAQKGNPGNQAAPSQTTVIVAGSIILLSPAEGKLIGAGDASKPVVFRWTAVMPKPKEAVTYRLKVWQLMQGQNGAEAMKLNQPVATKDVVNITQAAISNLYTGPCKPPYLCDFVWAVEVLNSEGVSIGNSYAGSNSFKFNIENQDPAKAEADNKGNAGNSGMSGGKSLEREKGTGQANGRSLDKEFDKSQPTKSIYKELDKSQPTKSIDKELDKSQPTKSIAKELDKSQPTKSIDKELDKSQPTKSIDKELDKSQPTKSIDKELDKGPNSVVKNGCCMNPCCSENAVWADDADVKSGAKLIREAQSKSAALYLPIEKIVYDANGNITGILIKTEKGEPGFVKVVVAGSHSLSGGVK